MKTVVIALVLCVVEILVIVIASPMAKPSLVLRFLPEDVQLAAKNHPEPSKRKQIMAHILLALALIAMFAGVIYLGIDVKRATEYMEMTGLNGYFDRLISATMVDEGKPSPKVYRYACEQLGLKPSECFAVEDAPNGVKSASAAGMNVIMVPDQSEPDCELEGLYDICVDSLDEIIALLNE